eukprot:4188-Pleurochrysis_carterae.AAC.1
MTAVLSTSSAHTKQCATLFGLSGSMRFARHMRWMHRIPSGSVDVQLKKTESHLTRFTPSERMRTLVRTDMKRSPLDEYDWNAWSNSFLFAELVPDTIWSANTCRSPW